MAAGTKAIPVVENVRRQKSLNPVTLENIMNIKWYIGLILVLVAMSFPAKAQTPLDLERNASNRI